MMIEKLLEIEKKMTEVITKDYKEAIDKQIKLALQFREKLSQKINVENKYFKLLDEVTEEIKPYNPKMFEEVKKIKTGFDRKIYTYTEAFKNSDAYKEIINIRGKNSKIKELDKLNFEVSKACYEYFVAMYNLDKNLADSRNILFSKEYLEKMDNLADSGLLLYFLETPDLPIMDYTIEEICEFFLFRKNSFLKSLISVYLISDSTNIVDIRKMEDVEAIIHLIDLGAYRASARNIFSLLEREHKNCANLLEGYFKKKKEFNNGEVRSNKITELISDFNDEYYKKIWKKIDYNYKKICNGTSTFINRNVIIHGDYDNDLIEVDRISIVKLSLLWINMIILTNSISLWCELVERIDIILPYITYLLAQNKK